MDHESNRKEFALEALASNRLRATVEGLFVERADRLVSKTTTDKIFRYRKTDRSAVCVFENGQSYLISSYEESERQHVYLSRIRIETLDIDRLTYGYGSLISSEFIVLPDQGLPRLFRKGPIQNPPIKPSFLFPEGTVPLAEQLEDLRQGIQSSEVWTADRTAKLIEDREEQKKKFKEAVCKSVGGYAAFMAGVRFRMFKSSITKKDI